MTSLRELLYTDEWAGSPHADAAVNEPFELVFYTRSRKLGHIFYRRFDGYFIRELADATQNHIVAVLATAYRPAEEDCMNNSELHLAVTSDTSASITTWVQQVGETTSRTLTRASGMSLLNGTKPIVDRTTGDAASAAYIGVSFVTF